MRKAARRDDNEDQIVAALIKIGCTVQRLSAAGVPDLLVGFHNYQGVAVNLLLEVKDGKKKPSEQKLTDDEAVWHKEWNGQVDIARSVEEAVKIVMHYKHALNGKWADRG